MPHAVRCAGRTAAPRFAALLAGAIACCDAPPPPGPRAAHEAPAAGRTVTERSLGARDAAARPSTLSRSARVERRRRAPPPPFRRRLESGRTYDFACFVQAGERVRFRVAVEGGPLRGHSLLDVVHEAPAADDVWIAHILELPAEPPDAAATARFEAVRPGILGAIAARVAPGTIPLRGGFSEPRPIGDAETRSSEPRPNVLLIVPRAEEGRHAGRALTPSPVRVAETLGLGGIWLTDVALSASGPQTAAREAGAGRMRLAAGAVLDASQLVRVLASSGYRTVMIGAVPRHCAIESDSTGFDLIRCPEVAGGREVAEEALAELRAFGERGPWLLALVAGARRPGQGAALEPARTVVAWIRERGLLAQTIVVLVSRPAEVDGVRGASRGAPVARPRAEALVAWKARWPAPSVARLDTPAADLPATIDRLVAAAAAGE